MPADEPRRPTDTPPARAESQTSPSAGPLYKGEPLEPARGPGLGCFWIQIGLLVVLLVATPLSVVLVAPPWLSAALLILTLVLLLFVGQTTIFLLRLVAADRRTRRRPLASGARKTVGQLEQEQGTKEAAETGGEARRIDDADTPDEAEAGRRASR